MFESFITESIMTKFDKAINAILKWLPNLQDSDFRNEFYDSLESSLDLEEKKDAVFQMIKAFSNIEELEKFYEFNDAENPMKSLKELRELSDEIVTRYIKGRLQLILR